MYTKLLRCDVCTTTEQYPSANLARQYGLRRMHRAGNILSKKKSTRVHTFFSLIYILTRPRGASQQPPTTPPRVIQKSYSRHGRVYILNIVYYYIVHAAAMRSARRNLSVSNEPFLCILGYLPKYHYSLLFLELLLVWRVEYAEKRTVTFHSSHIILMYHTYYNILQVKHTVQLCDGLFFN